jgi:hypothetical protein
VQHHSRLVGALLAEQALGEAQAGGGHRVTIWRTPQRRMVSSSVPVK